MGLGSKAPKGIESDHHSMTRWFLKQETIFFVFEEGPRQLSLRYKSYRYTSSHSDLFPKKTERDTQVLRQTRASRVSIKQSQREEGLSGFLWHLRAWTAIREATSRSCIPAHHRTFLRSLSKTPQARTRRPTGYSGLCERPRKGGTYDSRTRAVRPRARPAARRESVTPRHVQRVLRT